MHLDLPSFRAILAETGAINAEFRVRQEDDWPRTLDYWFGSNRWQSSGHSFDLVGVDGSGGLFCLWYQPGDKEEEPPVAILGSEGEGVSVIADDLCEFAGILAQGYSWSGSTQTWTRDIDSIFEAALRKYENMVRRLLKPSQGDPNTLLAAARARHSDLRAWVDTQVS